MLLPGFTLPNFRGATIQFRQCYKFTITNRLCRSASVTKTNPHCRSAQLLSQPDTCMFGDLQQFFVAAVHEQKFLFQNNGKLAWDSLLPLVKAGSATQPWGDCLTNGKRCCLMRTDCCAGGTSCRDFSYQNNDHPREVGDSIVLLASWCSIVNMLEHTSFTYSLRA